MMLKNGKRRERFSVLFSSLMHFHKSAKLIAQARHRNTLVDLDTLNLVFLTPIAS